MRDCVYAVPFLPKESVQCEIVTEKSFGMGYKKRKTGGGSHAQNKAIYRKTALFRSGAV